MDAGRRSAAHRAHTSTARALRIHRPSRGWRRPVRSRSAAGRTGPAVPAFVFPAPEVPPRRPGAFVCRRSAVRLARVPGASAPTRAWYAHRGAQNALTLTVAVRVRIAPSPTGDPHVGTAYVALFNAAL